MKNTILIVAIALITLISFSSSAAANSIEGNSLSQFGTYTLTPSGNCIVVDDVAYKTWDLVYSGTDEKYQVLYSPKADGTCCFMVRKDGFEIQYADGVNGFGVKLVDAGSRSIKKREVMKQINYDNFVSQIVLTQKNKTEKEYLGLVACFMPLLFG